MGIAYNTSIVRDGLVLHLDAANQKSYPGSGTIANDLTNNNGVGEIVGATFDQSNKAFSFDNGDRIGFGTDGGSLNVNPGETNELSVCAWIYPENPNDSRAPITRIDEWYFQVFSQNRLATYWYGRSPSGYHYSTPDSIPMNEWSFASVVWSTSDIKFYINAKLDTVINNVGGTGNQNNYIRVGYENSGREYEGSISQVSVYNKELNQEEISQNFEALRGRYGV